MITKKEFSQAIQDNASVVAGAIGVTTSSHDGLMPKKYMQSNINLSKTAGLTAKITSNLAMSSVVFYSFSHSYRGTIIGFITNEMETAMQTIKDIRLSSSLDYEFYIDSDKKTLYCKNARTDGAAMNVNVRILQEKFGNTDFTIEHADIPDTAMLVKITTIT